MRLLPPHRLDGVHANAATGRVTYVNGRFVPEAEAAISIYDSALMFGDMVFEMTRSFNGRQFKLREHLQRLCRSMKVLRIPMEASIDELERLCEETIERNRRYFDRDEEHRLMVNVSRGPLSIYHPLVLDTGPTLVISDFPLSLTLSAMGRLFDGGAHAVVPSQRAIPAELLDPKIKNRSRLHYMMANIEVAQTGDPNAWALLQDPDGFITEGTGANFFIVTAGQLWTPEPRNILRGISRDYAMELAGRLNIPVREKNIGLYDVMCADEAFFTATPFCILPCTKINGTDIGSGVRGAITTQLLDAWSANVGVDIVTQAKRFAARAAHLAAHSITPYSFRLPSVDAQTATADSV